jgi:hypothetical protein
MIMCFKSYVLLFPDEKLYFILLSCFIQKQKRHQIRYQNDNRGIALLHTQTGELGLDMSHKQIKKWLLDLGFLNKYVFL